MKKLILWLLCVAPCAAQMTTYISINGIPSQPYTVAQPPNAFPMPPYTATGFPNLQALPSASWTGCGSTCSGGTAGGTDTYIFGATRSSLSGSTLGIVTSGVTYASAQLYTNLTCTPFENGSCTGLTDLVADVEFYVPSTSATPQGIEGPDIVFYDGYDQFYPSVQCATNPGSATPSVATWNLWNSNGAAWVSTNISCAAYLAKTNTWQHVQVHYQVNQPGNEMLYQDIYVNGSPVAQNLNVHYYGAADASAATVKAQFQLDGNGAVTTGTTLYADNFTVWGWKSGGTVGILNVERTNPTISSGFGTSPSINANGTASFQVTVGTGGTATNGIIAFPLAAQFGWSCSAEDVTTQSTTVFITHEIASTVTSITAANFTDLGAQGAWTAGDVLDFSCTAH